MRFLNAVLALLGLGLSTGVMCAEDSVYGRAGGRVGADAIAHVNRDVRLTAVPLTMAPITIYGQAGLPVGADAIEYAVKRAQRSKAPVSLVDKGYGRAGGALGSGLPAEKRPVLAAGQVH